MPRKQLNSVLDAELGTDWSSKLRSFDYEPLAAASIGQVGSAEEVALHSIIFTECEFENSPQHYLILKMLLGAVLIINTYPLLINCHFFFQPGPSGSFEGRIRCCHENTIPWGCR